MVFSSKFQIVFKTLFVLIAIMKKVDCETFTECENVPDRTFTASSKSCSGYIYCNGDESFEGQCDDASYFNDEEKVCDDKEFVDCHIEDNGDTSTTITTTTTISPITSSTISPTSMANTTNANNLTAATVISTTTVAANISTIISTMSTTAATTTTTTSATTTTASTIIILTECPTVDNPFQIVLLANTKSCSEYFVCINGTPLEMFCSGMLHFNFITGKCDYPENVRCLPDYSKPKEQCRINIVDFYPHISNCNYYYRCQNGFLMLQQCPIFYGWDYEKRNCVAMNKAKCYTR